MNKHDASVIAILSKLGMRKDPSLTDQQEKDLYRAVHNTPHDDFLDNVEKLFTKPYNQIK